MTSLIKERLLAGQIVRTMHFAGLASPKLIEVCGALGNFHGLWIDQEHSGHTHAALELMLTACRAAGVDAFARVAPTDYAAVMRPMEAGCSGVMVAQIRTLEEVNRCVAWAKYPPMGIRGMFGANVEARFGSIPAPEHIVNANRERWLAVQIETVEAVDIADQIAAVEGVDWLFVGPADLSVALGVPGDYLHPKCIAALERVSAAVKRNGKAWGTLTRDPEHARRSRELGCQLFSIFGDVDCVRTGLRTIEQRYADFMD